MLDYVRVINSRIFIIIIIIIIIIINLCFIHLIFSVLPFVSFYCNLQFYSYVSLQ